MDPLIVRHIDFSQNQIKTCLAILLYWFATSDGQAEGEENSFILSFLKDSSPSLIKEIPLISNDLLSIQFSCEYLQKFSKPESKKDLISFFITLMVLDGRISLNERYALEFLCDVLGISGDELGNILKNEFNITFGKKPDLSSHIWWNSRDTNSENFESKNGQKQEGKKEDQQQNRKSSGERSNPGMDRNKALRILGLDSNASKDEIKAAYRKLSVQHHPDKYEFLGEDAVKAANVLFININLAYEYLAK